MINERETQFYIGGAWQERVDATCLPVVDPASERVIGRVAAGDADDVDLAVAAARKAFPDFSQSSVSERLDLLGRVYALIKERAELFAEALVMEMGAAISFARASQVPFAAEHVRVQIEVLQKYRFLTIDGLTATAKEPIGVCALITPWNWPLYQITAKVAPAIAAGCTVVLKPSELSPYSALLFAQLMHDAGIPPGVFNLVNGTGDIVGAALASHPDVDMISITGSTRAGVLVAQAAAPTVKRVVQELGGKSPNLFCSMTPISPGRCPRVSSPECAMSASRAALRRACSCPPVGSPRSRIWPAKARMRFASAIHGIRTQPWAPSPTGLSTSGCRP